MDVGIVTDSLCSGHLHCSSNKQLCQLVKPFYRYTLSTTCTSHAITNEASCKRLPLNFITWVSTYKAQLNDEDHKIKYRQFIYKNFAQY